MPFDLKGYAEDNKDFYGDKPLEDVAKDYYARAGGPEAGHTFDEWKNLADVHGQIQEDTDARAIEAAKNSKPGILAETGRTIARTAMEFPAQIGNLVKTVGANTEPAENVGNALIGMTDFAKKSHPELTASRQLDEAPWYHPRALASELAGGLTNMAPMFIPGIGEALGVGMMGGEAYQEARKEAMDQGKTGLDVVAPAITKAVINATGALVTKRIGGSLLSGFSKPIEGQVISSLTSGLPGKQIAANILKAVGAESLAFGAQNAASTAAMHGFGLEEDKSVVDDTVHGLRLGALLGIVFGASGQMYSERNKAEIRASLADPNKNPSAARNAVDAVYEGARGLDPVFADKFKHTAMLQVEAAEKFKAAEALQEKTGRKFESQPKPGKPIALFDSPYKDYGISPITTEGWADQKKAATWPDIEPETQDLSIDPAKQILGVSDNQTPEDVLFGRAPTRTTPRTDNEFIQADDLHNREVGEPGHPIASNPLTAIESEQFMHPETMKDWIDVVNGQWGREHDRQNAADIERQKQQVEGNEPKASKSVDEELQAFDDWKKKAGVASYDEYSSGPGGSVPEDQQFMDWATQARTKVYADLDKLTAEHKEAEGQSERDRLAAEIETRQQQASDIEKDMSSVDARMQAANKEPRGSRDLVDVQSKIASLVPEVGKSEVAMPELVQAMSEKPGIGDKVTSGDQSGTVFEGVGKKLRVRLDEGEGKSFKTVALTDEWKGVISDGQRKGKTETLLTKQTPDASAEKASAPSGVISGEVPNTEKKTPLSGEKNSTLESKAVKPESMPESKPEDQGKANAVGSTQGEGPDIKKIENKTETTPKEQKKYLVAKIDEALKDAPDKVDVVLKKGDLKFKSDPGDKVPHVTEMDADGTKQHYTAAVDTEKTPTVTIDIPGDGSFTVINDKAHLEKFKKMSNKMPQEEKQTAFGPTSATTTNKRINEEGVKYYNAFQPRKQNIVVNPDNIQGNVYTADGFFSDRNYAIKEKRPEKTSYGPTTALGSDFEKGNFVPAKLLGEFHDGTADTAVKIHVVSGTHETFLDSKYVDSILSKYPDAKPFMDTKSGNELVIFKDKSGLVGAVMPFQINRDAFRTSFDKRIEEVETGKPVVNREIDTKPVVDQKQGKGETQPNIEDEARSMSMDELSSMFDEVAGSNPEVKAETPAPAAPPAKAPGFGPNPKPKSVGTFGPKAEAKAAPEPKEKTLGDIAKEAASHGVKGVEESLKGLYEMFGGSALKSFPGGFDADAYQKAKPHFQAAFDSFKEAGKGVKEFFKFIIDNFGPGIKPYTMKYMEEFKSGIDKNDKTEYGKIGDLSSNKGGKTDGDTTESGSSRRSDELEGVKTSVLPGSEKGRSSDRAGDERGGADTKADTTTAKPGDTAPSGGINDQAGIHKPSGHGEAERKDNEQRLRNGQEPEQAPEGSTLKVKTEYAQRDPKAAVDYRITKDTRLGEGGQKTKYKNNVEAIRTLKAIQEAAREEGGGPAAGNEDYQLRDTAEPASGKKFGKITADTAREKYADVIKAASADGLKIQFGDQTSDIENPLHRQTMLTHEEDTGRQVKGYYHKPSNTLFVNVSHMDNMHEVTKTLAHELVGHKGLYDFMGEHLNPFLDFLVNHPKYGELIKQTGIDRSIDTSTERGRYQAAKEFFAETVGEGKVDPTIWTRFVVAFKKALIKMGFENDWVNKFDDNDIAEIIRGAHDMAMGGKETVSQSTLDRMNPEEKAPRGFGLNPQVNFSDKASPEKEGIDLSDTKPKKEEEPKNYVEAADIAKKVTYSTLSGAKDIVTGLKSLGLPTGLSPQHLGAAETLGAKLGEMFRQQSITKAATTEARNLFDKLGVFNKRISLDKNIGMQFASDMSMGRDVEPRFKGAEEVVNEEFKKRLIKLKLAGAEMKGVRENYFPGMWTKESIYAFNKAISEMKLDPEFDISTLSSKDKAMIKARTAELIAKRDGMDGDIGLSYLTKRPFKGGESFRKGKVFEDIMDAVNLGLEPISRNPMDLVSLKLAEMDRSIMANQALRDWERSEDVRTIWEGQKKPTDMQWINDRYAEVGHWNEDQKWVVDGKRAASIPVSDILNNYLSQTLYNNKYFGKAFKAYMEVGNALNQSQLGMGSLFHAGFTTVETLFSGMANNVKDVYGLIKGTRSMDDVMHGLMHTVISPVENPRIGGKILEAYQNPQLADMHSQIIAKAIELAGGKAFMDSALQSHQADKMMRDYYAGNKIMAAARAPVAAVELMAVPIMNWLVPRQKMGVFSELVDRILKDNPNVTPDRLHELTPEFRQAWNRVDSRLGQVAYDRLFINNTAKNVIQALVRAPGWSGGTIAEVGGAFGDTIKFVKEWKQTGEMPKNIPDRVAYTMALLVGAAVINGALTKMFSGKDPEGMDFWAFRTGGKDEFGRDERYIIPSYSKDIMAYARKPGDTLLSKSHPLLNMIGAMIHNKDYYGTKIVNEDDNLINKGMDLASYGIKQFIPFWMRGVQKMQGRDKSLVDMAAPLIGIMPAPSYFNKSKAEELMSDYMAEHREIGGRTKERAQKSELIRDITRKFITGHQEDGYKMIREAAAKGEINSTDMHTITKNIYTPATVGAFKRIAPSEALKVWDVATNEEKRVLRPYLLMKEKAAFREPPEVRAALIEKFKKALAS